MTVAEIETPILDYTAAARNAVQASLDGSELHASTTYLLPRFFQLCDKPANKPLWWTADNRVAYAAASGRGQHR